MSPSRQLRGLFNRLKRWEGLLLLLLIFTVIINVVQTPFYLSVSNQVNVFQLSIEKIIVAVIMTFIIINGEIDLSVASVMGLSAAVLAFLHGQGVPMQWAIVAALLTGVLCGAFNGFWVAFVGLPSLVVTLAGLIGYRGVARVLIEDRSIGEFPEWLDALGQDPLVGPLPLALILFFLLFAVGTVVLNFSAFGRYVYVIGNSKDVARYSGVKVRQVKMALFIASGTIAALAGLMIASRLGSVRGNTAAGFELDIITIVLLGGVSIFGGSGTLVGVGLAILLILNLRNGMSLINITGNTQTGVVGVLLILSVLVPNLVQMIRDRWNRRRLSAAAAHD
jgi:rhamnose transport system permease protein